jgi:hypothetical protein
MNEKKWVWMMKWCRVRKLPPANYEVWKLAEKMYDEVMKKINICTKENPMPKNSKRKWQHPDAIKVMDKDYDYGFITYDVYQCPNCGKIFKEEIPQ